MEDINKFFSLIEEGLLSYYLDQDYNSEETNVVGEPETLYISNGETYQRRAKNLLFRAKMAARKEAITNRLAKTTAKWKDEIVKGEGRVFNLFKEKMLNAGLSFNYRNFDKMSENDMKSILSQLDLTDILNEIESETEDE